MRNRIGLIAAWALVTLIGISVTSAAVGSVRNNVTDTVAPRFTVTEQAPSLAAADTTSTTTTAPAGDGAATPDAPPSTQDPAGAEADDTTDSSSAATTTAPPPDSTTTSSTTSTSAPPVTTTTAAPASVVKSYSAIGGSVTVEVTGDVVTLLGAVPNSGFSAEEKSRDDTDKVVVEFESESHSSKITVEVENGAVVADIDEEPEDD